MEIAETKTETVQEYQKSQNIRLIDIAFIGPVCIYAGVKYFKMMPRWLSISLISIGIATIYYNGKNYLINKKNER